MPATPTDDPVMIGLRAEYQGKYDEANRIIGDPSATGEKLVRAERITIKDLPDLERKIDERKADLDRLDRSREALSQSTAWRDQPRRTLPFTTGGGESKSYQNGAAKKDFTDYGPLDEPTRRYFEEGGPAAFGQAKWDTLSSTEYKSAFYKYLRKGSRELDTKILQEGLDDQGGVFAPAELIARVIGRLPAPTSLRGLVTTLTTGRDTLIMPRKQYSADDIYTTAFRVTWTGEIPSDGTGNIENVNDANLLGNVDIQVHTAMLAAPVTRNLIEDGAFPIQAWLESELAETIDVTYEDMIINGSTTAATTQGAQSGQPLGILFKAATGNSTQSNQYPEVINSTLAGGFLYPDFIATQAALAPQYETDQTRWIMQKRSTWAFLCDMVDSNNRPLFTTGMQDFGMVGRRGRVLLGDPIILSQLMPPMGSTTFPIIYGDLRGYFLAQRIGFSIQVLDQTRAKANQIELVGRIRFGGRTIEPWRLKIMKSNNT